MRVYRGTAVRSAMMQVAEKSARGGGAKKTHLLRWLMSFGALGLFLVAIVDSSVVPLPLPGSTDLLLLLLSSQRGTSDLSAAWLAFCAFGGSMIGGYLAWSAGKKGGEVTLERYVPKRHLKRITGWVEHRGFWSVFVAAILPPPIPLTPFVIAAGALKVPRWHFLGAFASARFLRYGFLAWLGVAYGRRIVRVWQHTLSGWGATVLWVYCGLVVVGILFGVWKYRQSAHKNPASQPA